MRPNREGRPAGDRTALGNFDNSTRHTFSSTVDCQQDAVADLRFRRAVERLHRLGPRPLYEMLVELGASRLIRTDIERQVERYVALDSNLLRQLGGDRFPPLPLHGVVNDG
jgi:hypothetical protein